MRDKFIMNFKIALPAAIITIIIMLISGTSGQVPSDLNYSLIKVIPYLSVLILALLGVNVFLVLIIGTVMSGAIGLADGSFTFIEFTQHIYAGYEGMGEIFVLSLLIGGLANLIAREGGIDYLINAVSRRIKSKKGAEVGIGVLVSVADICTANNTVAIVLTGPMAKQIADEHGIDPRRSASILDIFTCVWQGIIPYGAQMLMAGSIAKLSPVEIMPYLYYPYILAIVTLIAIATGFPKVKDKKDQIAKA